MKIYFAWPNYKSFPYERRLAARELEALTGHKPKEDEKGLVVEAADKWKQLASQVTYFREAVSEDGTRVVPTQTVLEALANGSDYSVGTRVGKFANISRQSTRYSGHGLHEYRGKFNPQIVRAIANIISLKQGQWLLDPFCGSGTALLEACHCGFNAVGVDLNPLAVEIANAKIAAMRVPIRVLRRDTDLLWSRLSERFSSLRLHEPFNANQIRRIAGSNWLQFSDSAEYLKSWFTESVLVQLVSILDEINKLRSPDSRLIMTIILSDIVRDVSLQDADDLRIRRQKSPPDNLPAVPMFLNSLSKKIPPILKARELVPLVQTNQVALLGDVTNLQTMLREKSVELPHKFFDAAITSPPYATALPYIDTQRLSLVLLGLIKATEIREVERSLIGNREISSKERNELERVLENNTEQLPENCLSFCKTLKSAIKPRSDGFRRQNVPALLYKYLSDMARMFHQVRLVLRKGAPYALIVGKNTTKLGGSQYVIDTPQLLSGLAIANGFKVAETINLDTYHRFDVHSANSIRKETLVLLESC